MIERSKAPQPADLIHFSLPEIKKFHLSNNIPVYFVKKTNLPIIQMSLLAKAGGLFDPAGKEGLAQITSMTIDEGAGGLSALEIDNEIETLGSVLDISCDKDEVFLSILSMSDKFLKTTELLKKIVTEPHFDEADFLREKEKLQTKIIQLNDDPNYLASSNFERIIYSGTCYSHPINGSKDSIDNISLSDIKEFHSKYFIAENISLVVVGNIEESELEKILESQFSKIKSGSPVSNNINTLANLKQKIYLTEKKGAAQSSIRLGNLCSNRDSADYFEKLLCNTILGGQFTSRLNHNLREVKGFTYGINSAFTYNSNFGIFQTMTNVETKNSLETISEIIKELELIKKSVTEQEIDFAKSYLINRFPSLFETYSQIGRNINTKVVYNLPDDYYDNYIDNIEKVTTERILSAAKNNININELQIVIAGDVKTLEKEFNEKFDVEII